MDKIKIKPFFYLILSRDGKGKLRFEVYDMAEERGSLLKDISTENGLLKYREEDKDLREYVKPLIDDIADAYSRMGRIVISYKGDIAHSEAVKETVRAYNEKHKDEADKPVFTFIEMKNNFSLEELVKKINFHFERAIQLTNSFNLDFSKVEYDPVFTNDEYENDSSKNKIKLKVSDNAVRNDKNSEKESNSDIVKKTKDILKSIPKISFEIKETVDQKEFLGYFQERIEPIDFTVSKLKELITAYTHIIDRYRNLIEIKKEYIPKKIEKDIIEKIKQIIHDDLIPSVEKQYDLYLFNVPNDYDSIPELKSGEMITINHLNNVLNKIVSSRFDRINKYFRKNSINNLKYFDNNVYSNICKIIKSYFPDSNVFSPKEYNWSFPFINIETECSAIRILNIKINASDVASELINAKPPLLKKENEFSIRKLSDGYCQVNSVSDLIRKTDRYIRTQYNKNEITNSLNVLMNRRIDSYKENTIPMIIKSIPDIDKSLGDTEEKIEFLVNERIKINEIYLDLSASIIEINSIIDTYEKTVSSEGE